MGAREIEQDLRGARALGLQALEELNGGLEFPVGHPGTGEPAANRLEGDAGLVAELGQNLGQHLQGDAVLWVHLENQLTGGDDGLGGAGVSVLAGQLLIQCDGLVAPAGLDVKRGELRAQTGNPGRGEDLAFELSPGLDVFGLLRRTEQSAIGLPSGVDLTVLEPKRGEAALGGCAVGLRGGQRDEDLPLGLGVTGQAMSLGQCAPDLDRPADLALRGADGRELFAGEQVIRVDLQDRFPRPPGHAIGVLGLGSPGQLAVDLDRLAVQSRSGESLAADLFDRAVRGIEPLDLRADLRDLLPALLRLQPVEG